MSKFKPIGFVVVVVFDQCYPTSYNLTGYTAAGLNSLGQNKH